MDDKNKQAEQGWNKVEANPVWNFDENPELEGMYISKEEEVGDNASNLYTFRLANGNDASVWGSSVLDLRFKNLEIGEQVKIVYLGKVPSKRRKGAEYKNYEVYHRKAVMQKVTEQDPDWIADADESVK